ncbi:kelch repeat-containing protein, partial [Candidatus Binatus sp.]
MRTRLARRASRTTRIFVMAFAAILTLPVGAHPMVTTVLKDGRVLLTSDPNFHAEGYDRDPRSWSARLIGWLEGDRPPRPEAAMGPQETLNAVLFDPATERFSYAGAMAALKQDYTSLVLSDGRVIFTAGRKLGPKDPAPAPESFDPETGEFETIESLRGFTAYCTPTLLQDGRVLMAGGWDQPAVVYDPATGSTKVIGHSLQGMLNPVTVLLKNGKVLIFGSSSSAEVYDPRSESFSSVGNFPENWAPSSAVTLRDGRVFIVGGEGGAGEHAIVPPQGVEEIYDPVKGKLVPTPHTTVARWHPLTVMLKDGTVLLVGGYGNPKSNWPSRSLESAEIYDPEDNTFRETGSLPSELADFRGNGNEKLTLLQNGQVLYTGVSISHPYTAALYDPLSGKFEALEGMSYAASPVAELKDGRVLLFPPGMAGGYGWMGTHMTGIQASSMAQELSKTALIFNPKNRLFESIP